MTKGEIYLARDHGGPWQTKEIKLNLGLKEAMELQKILQADIRAGFEMILIDPSIDIHSSPKIDEVLDRIYELYEFC